MYQKDAARLARIARSLSVAELRSLMGISEELATLNHTRFRSFAAKPKPEATRPAILAFAGDTYLGLEAATLGAESMGFVQNRLRILSGLYGILRPLDRIQPYRLEMGSRLSNPKGATLYDYWGPRITNTLNLLAEAEQTNFLVNCASIEYFAAIRRKSLKLRVITPVFLESRGGEPRIVSFFAKKARGAMARYILENRLSNPDDLRGFNTGGYRIAPDLTEGDRLVFLRDKAPPEQMIN